MLSDAYQHDTLFHTAPSTHTFLSIRQTMRDALTLRPLERMDGTLKPCIELRVLPNVPNQLNIQILDHAQPPSITHRPPPPLKDGRNPLTVTTHHSPDK